MSDMQDFARWAWWLVTDALGYAVQEASEALVGSARSNPWWTAAFALMVLGIWKLAQLANWLVRRVWVPVLLGALGAGAGLVLVTGAKFPVLGPTPTATATPGPTGTAAATPTVTLSPAAGPHDTRGRNPAVGTVMNVCGELREHAQQAVLITKEAQDTHRSWIDFLTDQPDYNTGGVGDVAHHRRWVSRYQVVVDVLETLLRRCRSRGAS